MPFPRQTILLCPPDYFGVEYVINPWMQNQIGKTDPSLAVKQWKFLRNALVPYADIVLATPKSGLPDMVFTANAGFVYGNNVIVSQFNTVERRGEEPLFSRWFIDRGFNLVPWPEGVFFEGAGDALFDRGQSLIWCGYGIRSTEGAAPHLERFVGTKTIGLKLVDPRFYHLDTCFCPMEGGYVMYYPAAFDASSVVRIEATIPKDKRIVVSEADALQFGCNAVEINKNVVMNTVSDALQSKLLEAGFKPVITPLSEFMKSGGSAKCLTLKLVEP